MPTQELLDVLLEDLRAVDRKIEGLNRRGVVDGPRIEYLKQLRSECLAHIRYIGRR